MTDTTELREYLTRNQPDRVVRKIPLAVRIYFMGLLGRLAGVEATQPPNYYNGRSDPDDPGMMLGRYEGTLAALRNEVRELAKALGLEAK